MTRSPLRTTLLALLALVAPAQAAGPAAPTETAPSAAAVDWVPFGPAAFRRALAEDRLILLALEVPWSPTVAAAHEKLWGDPRVAAAIREGYVAVRERADLRPELARRFPAPQWPAMTILLPDGHPLYFVSEGKEPRRLAFGPPPPDRLAAMLAEAHAYYRTEKRTAVETSRRKAAEVAEGAVPSKGPLEDPLVWAIRDDLRRGFDAEHRYFGGPPRLPETELIQLMLTVSADVEQPYREMATSALETLLAHLLDEDGAMFRMALGLDWEEPQKEKLLDRNARLLETLGLAYRVTGKRAYRERGVALARFLDRKLGLEGGAFAAGLCQSCPGGRDGTVLTGPNALAAAALMRAGAAFGDAAAIERGLAAASFLKERRYRKARGVAHAVVGRTAVPPTLLVLDDLAETGWAFVAAYEVTGETAWLDAARDVARVALTNLRRDGTGALADTLVDPDAPGPLRTPLFPLRPNAEMARLLVRLYYHNGSRLYRNGARDILAAFAGERARAPRDLPSLGLAAYEYLRPAMVAHVVAAGSRERADQLRRAALAVTFPYLLVHTWHLPADREEILSLGLTIGAEPAAAFRFGMLQSRQLGDPAGLSALAFDLEQKVRKQQEAIRQQKQEERRKPGADQGREGTR